MRSITTDANSPNIFQSLMTDIPEERYSMRVEWSEIDNAYKATCPAFPGLSAFGETREEALEEANVALSLFIEDYREEGDELPDPQVATEYSGQTRLRMPKWLHAALSEEAERQDVSLNMLMVSFLARQIGKEQERGRITNILMEFTKNVERVLPQAVNAQDSTYTQAASGGEYIQDPVVRNLKSGSSNQ